MRRVALKIRHPLEMWRRAALSLSLGGLSVLLYGGLSPVVDVASMTGSGQCILLGAAAYALGVFSFLVLTLAPFVNRLPAGASNRQRVMDYLEKNRDALKGIDSVTSAGEEITFGELEKLRKRINKQVVKQAWSDLKSRKRK